MSRKNIIASSCALFKIDGGKSKHILGCVLNYYKIKAFKQFLSNSFFYCDSNCKRTTKIIVMSVEILKACIFIQK